MWARVNHLLLGISVAMALPADIRDEKAFSLFSVVNFPNLECTTQMTDMKGICVTAEECSGRSGTASGNCASGFGVCCFTTVDSLTGTIVNNMTYLVNPGWPSAHAEVTTALNYQYTIQSDANIAAIRLDYQTGIFRQPNVQTGVCANDIVTTVEALNTVGGGHTLCGVLTGEHMYLDNTQGTANAANTISIALDVNAFARSWKILIRFIESGNPGIQGRASGCLQWFTDATGIVSSFNHDNAGALGAMNDDTYRVCIRPVANRGCVVWREAGGAVDSFRLDNGAIAAAANTVTVGAACAATYLIIPNNVGAASIDRYCGDLLGDLNAQTAATSVEAYRHYIDVVAAFGAATNPAAGGTGFELIYNQMTCS